MRSFYLVFIGYITFILIGCGNSSEPVSISHKQELNYTIYIDSYVQKVFDNIDMTNYNSLYHLENILIFPNLYISKYDNNLSKKINFFLYQNHIANGKKYAEDIKQAENRLDILQYLYFISENIKNNLNNNKMLSNKELIQFQEEYKYLLNDVLLPFWFNYTAWHWEKNYNNMDDRISAKLRKDDKLKTLSYYTAFIDEDGFSCSIASDLIFINKKFSKKLNIDINITKLLHIRDICTKYIKTKTIITKNTFHFGVGDWADHPDYAYADCNSSAYPIQKCIDKYIERDTSHFSRFPWWIRSMKDSYEPNEQDYRFYNQWLTVFGKHFNKNILVKIENAYLLNNFINGKNGWFRVGYHKEYDEFGYGPYKLSLISALGSYYVLVENNHSICKYIDASSQLFSLQNGKYIKYFDEKYKTTYTKFLIKTGLFKDRFKYYNNLSKMAYHNWCIKK